MCDGHSRHHGQINIECGGSLSVTLKDIECGGSLSVTLKDIECGGSLSVILKDIECYKGNHICYTELSTMHYKANQKITHS